MLLRAIAITIAVLTTCTPASAQSNPPANVTMLNGQPRATTPAAIVDNNGKTLGTSDNPLVTSGGGGGGTGAAASQVQGNSASGAADTGFPVKIGGLYPAATTLTTLSGGNRGDVLLDLYGNLRVALTGLAAGPNATATQAGYIYSRTSNSNASNVVVPLATMGGYFDGANVQPARGDTTGAYVVSKGTTTLGTAQVSVGTGATLVAAARAGRSRLVITQSAAGPCYYSASAAVSATTGARLTAAGASKVYQYAGALYGICPGGAQVTDVDEEY